jgi:uncharacterized protein with HEPN domain
MSKPEEKLDSRDMAAIRAIMAYLNCDYETAKEVWEKYINETAPKIKEMLQKE